MSPFPAESSSEALAAFFSPRMHLFWMGLSFLMGTLWGSFFNVCIYRLPMGLSPNRPRRSFCFSCGMPIAWFDNIPLLSWLILRGRCRHCGARISPRYFLIELLTGCVFAGLWWCVNRPELVTVRGFSLSVFWYWTVAGLLIVGAMTDLDHWIIPDGITRGGLVAALAAALLLPAMDGSSIIARSGPFPAIRHARMSDPVEVVSAILGQDPSVQRDPWMGGRVPSRASSARGPSPAPVAGAKESAPSAVSARPYRWWEPLANSAIGALTGYGFLWMIALMGRLAFRKEAMGGGDLKLFAFLGAVFGPLMVILLVFLSSMVGVVLGAVAIGWGVLRPPRRMTPAELLAPVVEGFEAGYALAGGGPAGGAVAESPRDGAGDAGACADAAASGLDEHKQANMPSSAMAKESLQEESSPKVLADEIARRVHDHLVYARKSPIPRALHHIPFGPSISLAALLLLFIHDPLRDLVVSFLLPTF